MRLGRGLLATTEIKKFSFCNPLFELVERLDARQAAARQICLAKSLLIIVPSQASGCPGYGSINVK
jgi:hypothetical protein